MASRLKASTVLRQVGDLQIVAAGQSIISSMYFYVFGYAFQNRVQEILGVNPATVPPGIPHGIGWGPHSSGGSFVSRKLQDALVVTLGADAAGAVWIDDRAGLADDARMTVTLTGTGGMSTRVPRIQHALTDLGYSCAAVLNGQTSYSPIAAMAIFYTAYAHYGHRIKSETVLGDVAATKVGIAMIGRTPNHGGNRWGYGRARNLQNQLIIDQPGFFRLCEFWDVELSTSAHISAAAQEEVARRAADSYCKYVFGVAALEGPTVASSTKVNDTTMRVVFTPEVGDTISFPASGIIPCGYGIGPTSFDYHQVITPLNNPVQVPIGVGYPAPNTMDLTIPIPIPGAMTLFYPNDDIPDFRVGGVVKGALSQKPVRSGVIAAIA